MRAIRVAVGVAAVLTVGCGPRATITRTHGQAFRAAFAQQGVGAPRRPVEPAPGLDSQEAAIIADGYRSSLAPKGAKPSQEGEVILLAPAGRPAGTGGQAPSVPR